MKTLRYILFFALSMGMLNSCLVSDETTFDANDTGNNVVTPTRNSINLTAIANGDEYIMEIPIKITGPTVTELTNDITVQVSAASGSTAIANTHYKFVNPTITLSKSNNYLENLKVTLITDGNAPPMEDSPEYEDYVAPILNLQFTASGDAKVVGTGKDVVVKINFIAPNPYAGDYAVEMRYFHPTAGGTHPSQPNFNPDDPFGGIRALEKTLVPITGRQCETGFGVWGDTDICWITVNSDNSISFVVDDTWPYDVALGDPFDSSKVSHYDPATGKIYLYYHYYGSGGARIFWEVFTPLF